MTETVTESVTTEEFEAKVAEADSILDKLLGAISDVDEAIPYRKMLLYANFGTGKTVFCATAPRPLIVAVEPTGTLSLLNHPDLKDKCKVMQFKSVVQLELLLDKMIEKPEAFDFCDTLVIDSFSELQKWDLDDIVAKAAKTDASRNKFLPIGPDYNINTEHMRQLAGKLERVNKHVIITCHVKEEKDESTGRILVRPNLTPKLAGTLGGKFDIVGYMSMQGSGENAVRTLQCHPTPTVMAKTRIGSLPAIVENPTFESVFGNI